VKLEANSDTMPLFDFRAGLPETRGALKSADAQGDVRRVGRGRRRSSGSRPSLPLIPPHVPARGGGTGLALTVRRPRRRMRATLGPWAG
jgi:hypothetical protein